MIEPVFDAKGFVEFDLTAGQISSVGNDRLALIPLEVLASLSPSKELDEAARKWGQAHGARLAQGLPADAGVQALADNLGGTAAVLGLGRLSIEIRGDALLLKISKKAQVAATKGGTALLMGFLGGYLTAIAGDSFELVAMGDKNDELLFFAGNGEAAGTVRKSIENGGEPIEAIGQLKTRSL
jgi:hypothetical protein